MTALAAGCGGDDFDPQGRPAGVLYEVVWDPTPIGLNPDSPPPQPLLVRLGHQRWGEVRPIIPSPLPEPIDQGDECLSGFKVTVRLTSGEEVEYGPCRRPENIEPLRRLLDRMVRERDR